MFNLLKCVCCADWDKVLESLSIPRRELYKLEAETINRVLSDVSSGFFFERTQQKYLRRRCASPQQSNVSKRTRKGVVERFVI